MAAFSVFAHQPWPTTLHKSDMSGPRQLPALSLPGQPSLPKVRGKQIAFQSKISVMPQRIWSGSRENSLPTTPANSARESNWESEALGPHAIARYLNASETPREKLAVKLNLAPRTNPKKPSPSYLKTWSGDGDANSVHAKNELGPNNDRYEDGRCPQFQSERSHRERWTATDAESSAYSDTGVFFTGGTNDWPTPPRAPVWPEELSKRKYSGITGENFSDLRIGGNSGDTTKTTPRKSEKVRFWQKSRKEKGLSRKQTSRVHSHSTVRSLGNQSFITEPGRSSRLHRREGKLPSGSESGVSSISQRKTPKAKRPTDTSRACAEGSNSQIPESVMFSRASSPSDHCKAFEQYKKLTRRGNQHKEDVELSDGTSVDSGKRSPPPKLCYSSQQMSSSVDPVKRSDDLRHRIRRGRLSPDGLSSSMSRDLLDDFTSHDSVRAGRFSCDTRSDFGFTGSLGKSSEGGLSQLGNSLKLSEYMAPNATYQNEITRTSRGSEPQMNTPHMPADFPGLKSSAASSVSTLQTPRNKAHGMPPKQKKQKCMPYIPLQPNSRPKSMSDLNNPDPRVHSLKGEQTYLPQTSSVTWQQPGQSPGRFPQSSLHGLIKSKPHITTGSPQWREALASDPVTQISMLSPHCGTPSSEPEAECNYRLHRAQLRDMAYFAYAVTGERAKFPGDVLEVVQYEPEASPKAQSETDTADMHMSRKYEDPATSKQGCRRRPLVQYLYDENGHRTQKIVTYKPRNSKPRGLPPGRQMSISRSPFELNNFFLSNSFGFGRSGWKRRGRRHKKGKTASRKRTKDRKTRSKSELSPLESSYKVPSGERKLQPRKSHSNLNGCKTPRQVKSLDHSSQLTDDVSPGYRSESKQNVQKQRTKSMENLPSFGPWESKQSKHSGMHRRKRTHRRRRRRKKRRGRKKWDDSDVDDSSDSITTGIAQTIHSFKQIHTMYDKRDDKAENVLTAGMVSPGVCQRDNIPVCQTMRRLGSGQKQDLAKNSTKHFSSTDKGKRLRIHDSGNGRTSRRRITNRSHSNATALKTAGRERTISPLYKYNDRNQQKNTAPFRRGRNRRTRLNKDDVFQRLSGSVQRSSHFGCPEGNSDKPTITAGNSSRTRGFSPSDTKITGVLPRLSKTHVKARPSGTLTLKKRASPSRQAKINYSSVPAKIDTGLNPGNYPMQQNGATRDSAASVQLGPDLSGTGDSKLRENSFKEFNQSCFWKARANVDSSVTHETRQKPARRQTEELSHIECLSCRPCLRANCLRPTSARPPQNSEEALIEKTARKVVQVISNRLDNRKANF